MNLTQKTIGYFTGANIHREEAYQRGYVREYVTNPTMMNKFIQFSKSKELLGIALGKIVPTFFSGLVIGHSLVTKEPPYFLGMSEGMRALFSFYNYQSRKMNEGSRKVLHTLSLLNDCSNNLNNLVDLIDNEGEEWKNQ